MIDIGGSKKNEYIRTCEMFVNICNTQGAYFALALLYDSEYDRDDIKQILSILYKTEGSRKI